MREEFHGTGTENWGELKQLYHWDTLNTIVWLPSVRELIGTTGIQNTDTGCYYSAMQGLNLSEYAWTDAQGGTQFTYLEQYNQSGGGQKLWDACNREMTWMRSTDLGKTTAAWRITNATAFNTMLATVSHAVHPAV